MARRGRQKNVEPTPEQLAQGIYKRKFVMHAESATEAMTHVSRHDPVERWKAANRLEDHQIAAIELCQRLWAIAGLPIKVTGNYGERISTTGSTELLNNSQIDARKDLYRIQDYFAGLEKWWSVFELVCRFGEAAGVAGSHLSQGSTRSADVRAHQCVLFCADIIATRERL